MGTPDFLSPEQARSLHKTDIRSDLYSLGCTFYYLLTGEVPFPGGNALDKLLRHSTEKAPCVTELRPDRHTVTLDGVEPLSYDKLLLATGSRVRTLDLPGVELVAVRYLRTLTEADALVDHIRESRRVVVVGAGWIGLETAAAARTHGAEVTVVEIDSLPLRRVLGDEVAQVFADLHRAHGVEFRFGEKAVEFRPGMVITSAGAEIPTREAPRRPGDPPMLVAAGEKIRAELGWEPEHDLERMIRDAWEWRQARPEGYGSSNGAS